jgi:glycosyltransferase involved in cell wall biosynthesis
MKISLITVSYQSVATIRKTIESVISQKFDNIEYIVIDGNSCDGTIDLIRSFGINIHRFISEPDKGIYNAMNKGIKLATGDVVGILNSDDFFVNDMVIEKVSETFLNSDIDVLYADVQFVDPNNINKVVRYYSSKRFKPSKFKYGFMPAHPSFYARRELFEKIGYYKENYQIASDYELLIRFLYKHKLKSKYIEMPFVSMRTGGISNKSLKSNYILNQEIIRACKENGINTNIFYVYSKYFTKVFELFGNNSF